MAKEMLINMVEGQECRIAIVSDQGLEELYVERASSASRVGNIYKGRITNVEAAIQAAFVDFGLHKNGFLHISDLKPSFFPKGQTATEQIGRKRPHRVRPPIQACLRRGQEVVVQMTKEGIGTKGPTMTTYLSIPGRLVVMMPGMTRLGVSRKVEDEASRTKARSLLSELKLPQEMGFILRTAGVTRPKREIQRDLNYLLRLWKTVNQRIRNSRAPAEIYQESDLVIRTIRDVYNSEIDRIVCDSEAVARKVKDFLHVAVPRGKHTIELYTGKEGLFYDYGLEEEIERFHSRHVELRSGGSLVIDQAEALVAIDINSGRFRKHADAETTALKINIEAAKEIVRQLRLRDMGGVIVIDFIDMREPRNIRTVERTLRDALKNDRAKTKVLRMSAFGIVELTRQRVRPSLKQSVFTRCPHCDGAGMIRTEESLSLGAMRDLQRACANDDVAQIKLEVRPVVAHYLGNFQRRQIHGLEAEAGKTIILTAKDDLRAEDWRITCTNRRGSVITWDVPRPAGGKRRKLSTISIDELPPPPPPPAPEPAKPAEAVPEAAPDRTEREAAAAEPEAAAEPKKKRSRRGRRGGRKHRPRHEEPEVPAETHAEAAPAASEMETTAAEAAAEPAKPEAKKPSRRRKRARKKAQPHEAPPEAEAPKAEAPTEPKADDQAKPARKKARRRRPSKKPAEKEAPTGDSAPPDEAPAAKPKRRRRPRRKAKPPSARTGETGAPAGDHAQQPPGHEGGES